MAQNNSCTCLDVLSIDLTSCIRTGFIYLHHAYVPRRLYAWRSLDVCHAYLDLSQPEQAINVCTLDRTIRPRRTHTCMTIIGTDGSKEDRDAHSHDWDAGYSYTAARP